MSRETASLRRRAAFQPPGDGKELRSFCRMHGLIRYRWRGNTGEGRPFPGPRSFRRSSFSCFSSNWRDLRKAQGGFGQYVWDTQGEQKRSYHDHSVSSNEKHFHVPGDRLKRTQSISRYQSSSRLTALAMGCLTLTFDTAPSSPTSTNVIVSSTSERMRFMCAS